MTTVERPWDGSLSKTELKRLDDALRRRVKAARREQRELEQAAFRDAGRPDPWLDLDLPDED
jgi:hypothetical protein